MKSLTGKLIERARILPEGDLRTLVFRAAGEIEALSEQLAVLRDAFAVIDKAVRSPDTINALSKRNP